MARWYSINHLPRPPVSARSYRRVATWRQWALIIIRRDPPNADQSRKPGGR